MSPKRPPPPPCEPSFGCTVLADPPPIVPGSDSIFTCQLRSLFFLSISASCLRASASSLSAVEARLMLTAAASSASSTFSLISCRSSERPPVGRPLMGLLICPPSSIWGSTRHIYILACSTLVARSWEPSISLSSRANSAWASTIRFPPRRCVRPTSAILSKYSWSAVPPTSAAALAASRDTSRAATLEQAASHCSLCSSKEAFRASILASASSRLERAVSRSRSASFWALAAASTVQALSLAQAVALSRAASAASARASSPSSFFRN
mmetsp:Transcript_20448/g.56677  ORF Transcript_20448/g.56677 Transcript_20448/m.56677 type:complete len:268 (+) Transcript_20448:343-1146(+)